MGTYGSPCILQSDNGKEFRNSVVYNLKKLWHNLKIIHGRPRHPQSQGSVERSDGDIQGILGSWMRDNNSTKWSLALPMVIFTKNNKFHRGVKLSPYKAVFGWDAFLGLDSLNLPQAEVEKITTVKELYNLLGIIYS